MGVYKARPPKMSNYKIALEIERDTTRNADGSDVVWEHNNRIDLCEPFISKTVEFAADLRPFVRTPSIFDEGKLVTQCLDYECKPETVKPWIFLHLFDHAVQQANAILYLFEASFIQSSLQLWRSLLEASVICDFIAKKQAKHPKLCQDYITHTLLRMWIRHKRDYNRYWQKKEKEPYYDTAEISRMEAAFKDRFCSSFDDYSWTIPSFQKPLKFSDMLEGIDGHEQLSFFYRLSSKEIHPTLGSRYMILDLSLPLPIVPMLPHGDGHIFSNYSEMYLDHLTIVVLLLIINRVSDFLTLDDDLEQRLTTISADGKKVLHKLEKQQKG